MPKPFDPSDPRYVRKWVVARTPGSCYFCGAHIAPRQRYWQVAPGFVSAVRFCDESCVARYVSRYVRRQS